MVSSKNKAEQNQTALELTGKALKKALRKDRGFLKDANKEKNVKQIQAANKDLFTFARGVGMYSSKDGWGSIREILKDTGYINGDEKNQKKIDAEANKFITQLTKQLQVEANINPKSKAAIALKKIKEKILLVRNKKNKPQTQKNKQLSGVTDQFPENGLVVKARNSMRSQFLNTVKKEQSGASITKSEKDTKPNWRNRLWRAVIQKNINTQSQEIMSEPIGYSSPEDILNNSGGESKAKKPDNGPGVPLYAQFLGSEKGSKRNSDDSSNYDRLNDSKAIESFYMQIKNGITSPNVLLGNSAQVVPDTKNESDRQDNEPVYAYAKDAGHSQNQNNSSPEYTNIEFQQLKPTYVFHQPEGHNNEGVYASAMDAEHSQNQSVNSQFDTDNKSLPEYENIKFPEPVYVLHRSNKQESTYMNADEISKNNAPKP